MSAETPPQSPPPPRPRPGDRARDRRGVIAFMARNGVASNLLMIAMIIAGVLAFGRIVQEVFPEAGLQQLVKRSIGWWAKTGTLPNPNNRIYWQKDSHFGRQRKKLRYEFTPNNLEAHDRLVYRWMGVLKSLENSGIGLRSGSLYPRGEAPVQVVGYQCGTARMGTDPATSVLDINCRTHQIANLYVVDSSFFPSCPSIGPALTVMANALRVGEYIAGQL